MLDLYTCTLYKIICSWWESNLRFLFKLNFSIAFNGSNQFVVKNLTTVIKKDNQKGMLSKIKCIPYFNYYSLIEISKREILEH